MLWHRAPPAYRGRQSDEAESALSTLQRMVPGRGLYSLYAGRVAGFRRAPPPEGWDGVTAFAEK